MDNDIKNSQNSLIFDHVRDTTVVIVKDAISYLLEKTYVRKNIIDQLQFEIDGFCKEKYKEKSLDDLSRELQEHEQRRFDLGSSSTTK